MINGILKNNTCRDNWDGIYLYSSSKNTILNSACNNNGYDGIELVESSSNTLSNVPEFSAMVWLAIIALLGIIGVVRRKLS